MAELYNISLDELVEFDADVREIERVIEKTSEQTQRKVDWTKLWSKKYPILKEYQNEVDVEFYGVKIKELLCNLKKEYGYNNTDACLVLKDILAKVWNDV